MTKAYITEFSDMQQLTGHLIGAANQPDIATQVVDYTSAHAESAAFNVKTKFIRIHVDSIASIKFGTAPVATTSHPRMAAGATEYYGVRAGDIVSVVTNT